MDEQKTGLAAEQTQPMPLPAAQRETSRTTVSAHGFLRRIFTGAPLRRHSLLQSGAILCGIVSLLALFASLYVNCGLYRAKLILQPQHIEAAGRAGLYQYSLAQLSEREKVYTQLLPAGGARFYGGRGNPFAKRKTYEDLLGLPGDGFFVTPEMLFFTVADGLDPRLGAPEYRFERPVRPRWTFTVLALFFLLTSIVVYRFQAGTYELWAVVHALVFITLFSTILWTTIRAPGGLFLNVYGGSVGMWYDCDPGSWYLVTAHELGRTPAVYPGHPGIPMVIGLACIQKAIAFFAADAFTFSEAVAVNIFYVQVLSRMMCMLIFVAAALVLRKIAILMFSSTFVGTMASLLFSTSFFSVYYMNRVSPEGFAVLFFLLSFLFFLLARRSAAKPFRVCLYAFSACFSSVVAFYSKIHLMGGLPFFIAACIAVCLFRPRMVRSYLLVLCSGLLGFVSAWLCLDRYMDWASFNASWAIGQHAAPGIVIWAYYYHKALDISAKVIGYMGRLSLQALLPITDQSRTAFAFGSGLVLFFLISFFWKAVRNNTVFLCMCLYTAFTVAIFFYRGFSMRDFGIAVVQNFGGFHYLFPFFAVASLASAFVINQILQKNSDGSPKKHGLFALLLVCLLNMNGFLVAMDMHMHRVRANAKTLPLYGMLSRLEPKEVIRSSIDIPQVLGLKVSKAEIYNFGEPSKLEQALEHMRSH